MGKRSNFERRERDFYPTPVESIVPLLPHLPDVLTFWEPCAGDGALVDGLFSLRDNVVCDGSDIEPRAEWIAKADALVTQIPPYLGMIITNPPWSRDILHPMIEHFSAMRPTWLLFDADWMHTKQSAPFMPLLRKVVSVGRVKWIPDSKFTGKDNACWYLFDANSEGQTEFYGRSA
ncbi:class I SAM-dependent methyltransferase [Celeribacter sp. SCSIO 80788]|uniref:class I SAM-dependent methyltransferase n=1 Tax=Celeribacter sp. SCSIO 80788 TaxID=3117013 RepID=UPI003DA27152